jgi:hypothetical protein
MVRSFGTASTTRALLQGFPPTFHQIGRYSKLQQNFPLLNILCDPVINDIKGFLTAARVVLDTIMKDVNCLGRQSSLCGIKNHSPYRRLYFGERLSRSNSPFIASAFAQGPSWF